MMTNSLAHFPLRSGVYVSVSWNWAGSVIAQIIELEGCDTMWTMQCWWRSMERTTECAWKYRGPSQALGWQHDLPALGESQKRLFDSRLGSCSLMPRESEGSCGHSPTQAVNSWANERCCFKQQHFRGMVYDSAIDNWKSLFLLDKNIHQVSYWWLYWGSAFVWCLCEFYHSLSYKTKAVILRTVAK